MKVCLKKEIALNDEKDIFNLIFLKVCHAPVMNS
jgi:hypothetical protein